MPLTFPRDRGGRHHGPRDCQRDTKLKQTRSGVVKDPPGEICLTLASQWASARRLRLKRLLRSYLPRSYPVARLWGCWGDSMPSCRLIPLVLLSSTLLAACDGRILMVVAAQPGPSIRPGHVDLVRDIPAVPVPGPTATAPPASPSPATAMPSGLAPPPAGTPPATATPPTATTGGGGAGVSLVAATPSPPPASVGVTLGLGLAPVSME